MDPRGPQKGPGGPRGPKLGLEEEEEIPLGAKSKDLGAKSKDLGGKV